MSHLKERKEKNCLNCGTLIQGRFCQNCGQENIEPKESLWHLIRHFFNDVTHFDGKFFSSLKYLLSRPGFLSKEYIAGKRASYLNPIRMYLFTSAIFFVLFFSVFTPEIIKFSVKPGMDNNNNTGTNPTLPRKKDFKPDKKVLLSPSDVSNKPNSKSEVKISSSTYRSKVEYDSLLKAGVKKDNWLTRQFIYKSIEVNASYKNNPGALIDLFSDKFLHTFPQMFFISLPIFALILKLAYVRRRQYSYTDHLIFSLHTYIFIFIALMASFSINKLGTLANWSWLSYVQAFIGLVIVFYLYRAMRSFYNQGRIKTILKFLLICLLLLITGIALFSFFLFMSFFQL